MGSFVTSQRLALEIVCFGESSPLTALKRVERGEDSPKRTISRARRWDVTDGIRARLGSVCQRGRWALRGVDCKVPHRLGRRTKGAIYRPGYLPLSTRFKTVRGEDSPKRRISRARRWDVTDILG